MFERLSPNSYRAFQALVAFMLLVSKRRTIERKREILKQE
jgi:hypothetical protein